MRAINQADNEIDCDNPGMGADRQIKNVFARHNQQMEIDCVIDLARIIKRLQERLLHIFPVFYRVSSFSLKKLEILH